MVSLQSEKRVSGQVTVGIGVTGMIISSTCMVAGLCARSVGEPLPSSGNRESLFQTHFFTTEGVFFWGACAVAFERRHRPAGEASLRPKCGELSHKDIHSVFTIEVLEKASDFDAPVDAVTHAPFGSCCTGPTAFRRPVVESICGLVSASLASSFGAFRYEKPSRSGQRRHPTTTSGLI